MQTGCDRNIEPYKEGEESSPPDLARIFPGAPGGADQAPNADAQAGPVARQAFPPTRTEAAARPVAGGSAPIEGSIEIAPERAGALPAGGVLFVIARSQGAQGGPPLAVLRIPEPSFPLSFRIGPDDVMIPSMQFVGSISLSARLDADGNAMTRGAEDLSSAVEESLEPGATGVRLVLSEKG
jgi:hypothetical protein